MAERDISPRAGGPPDPRSDRDPTALAAWRRVAEQRRRRQIEPGEPEERAEHQGEPAPPTDVARRGTDAGSDGVPRTPTRGDGGAGPRHDLLLALAGRLDDDALSTVRELVAVDDAAAAEMLGGCLLADRIAVTDRERAQLDRWFAGARVDPELLGALPVDPDAAGRARHRFLPDLPGVPTDDGEAVARAAARLPGVAHVRQCWRVTPAGGSPGPLPHRVVLVETESADDCEHVAHHAVHAARSRGAVSVEVYARGAALPAYQRDAVEAAGTGAPVPATSPAVSSSAVSSSAGATPTVTGTTPALPVRRRPGGDVAAAAAALRGERDAAPRALEAPGTDEVAGVTDSDAVGALDELEGLDEAGDLVDAEDPEDRRDTEGWRVVADSDRGATSDGWSMPASVGDDRRDGAAADGAAAEGAAAEGAAAEGTAAEGAAVGGRSEDEAAGRESIADLDPDAAAARIAALWREPSPVDAFDAPLDDAWSPNLLEPDLPEPDLAHEMSRYDTPRPMTGSFGRVDGEDGPERGDIGHDTEDARDRGDLGALGHPGDLGDLDDEAPTGAHARSGPDAPPFDPRDAAGPDPWSGGRIRRARHSRAGADDEPGPGVDHDIRFGADAPWREGADLTSPVDLEPATTTPTPTAQPPQGPAGDAATGGAPPTRPEPPTGPVSVPAGGAATSTPPPSTPAPNPTSPPAANHPEAEEAMSQLSDRERDLLSRLHAELAARERLETGEPDPFAARGGDPAAPPRPSPGPRPSPSPRRPAGDDPDAVTQGGPLPGRVNGHAHGPLDGHPPGQTNGHTPGRTNGHGPSGGHGPRNGHGLPSAPDEPEDEAR